MYLLVISVTAKDGAGDALAAELAEVAAASTAGEPGCRAFDVYRDAADPLAFTLVELYDDEAAFEAHKEAPHFAKVAAALPDLVADRARLVGGPVTRA